MAHLLFRAAWVCRFRMLDGEDALMCNACGNHCCGSDQFEGCGCDGCFEPDCWSDDEDELDEDDDFYDHGDYEPPRAHSHFRCVEVTS